MELPPPPPPSALPPPPPPPSIIPPPPPPPEEPPAKKRKVGWGGQAKFPRRQLELEQFSMSLNMPPEMETDPPSPPPPPAPASMRARKVDEGEKKRPVDLEQLLREKKAAEAAAAKPKFMRKAERERIKAEQDAREEPNGKELNGRGPNGISKFSRGKFGKSSNGSNGSRLPPTEPSAERNQKGQTQAQLEAALRERYMGPDLSASKFVASKKRKNEGRKKFKFDWDDEEDTSHRGEEPEKDRNASNRAASQWDEFEIPERSYAKARMIEDGDPVTGKQRAAEFLELEQRRVERNKVRFASQHWSDKPLSQMRARDWRIFKEDFNITTKGGILPNPMRNWAESGLPPDILRIVEQVGYTEPSAVQRASIPIALQSRDLIGVAVTGSGKTAAFLLPLLVYMKGLPPLRREDGPYSIILAPTRELAQQIEVEARKFASPLGFSCVSIVGGHNIEEQVQALSNGAEIIIATPGRLLDCLERKVLILAQCCYVVMDEADRMIDQGFEDSVNRILDALPVSNEKPDSDAAEDAAAMQMRAYRQTMMFSATMPPAVRRIAERYLRRPATVTIGNAGEAVETVEQRVEFVTGEDKRKRRLAEILNSYAFRPPIIVFVNIKANCDAVARDIRHMGFKAVTLHGSKTQEQREAALASVRRGETEILVATDLAGRGIDVQDVSLVVNFNMSKSIESYTHRIGRTGRAGKSGVAITFLGNEDADVMYDLKQMLTKSQISKVPEELRKHEAAQQRKGAHKKIE